MLLGYAYGAASGQTGTHADGTGCGHHGKTLFVESALMQYSAAEYRGHCGWGHSSLAHTLDFGTLTEVKQLVPFHHDPSHSDIDLDRLMAEAIEAAKPVYQVTPGTEGAIFEL